ncbi:hypothetical protein ACFPMF_07390 [Larkinella bovis]|uniref:Phage tail tape measure protein n=1 Tax=Larkinella bovis TaxID=683041 RepID=A0ABW0I787_9BACT
MSQEKENEVLIEITIDEAATEKRIAGLRKSLEDLRAEKARIKKEFKAGAITSEEYATAISKNERATKALTTEMKANERALTLNDKANKAVSGSLNEMRTRLAQYKDLIGDLSPEERASKAGRDFIKMTNDLNEEVLGIEKSYGVAGRGVARYADGIREAIGSQVPIIGQLKSIHGLLTDGISYLKENRQGWIDQAKSIQLSSIGVTGFGKAAKAALAATGIGLLVLAFTALIGFLTKTQTGMDFIERKTKAFGAVVSLISRGIYSLGELLVNVWTKPGETIKKFGDFIQENLINRVKGFGVILKAIGEGNWVGMMDGVVQVATGITDASKKASGFADELERAAKAGEANALESQKIRDLSIQMEARYKQMRGEAERLKQIADDTTKPYNDRLAAIRKAGELESRLQKEREAFQKRVVANVKEEAKLNGNNFEDRKKVAEAEAELGDIREERYERATEIQNTLNGLVTEEKEKSIEASKEALSAQIAGNELRLNAAKKLGRDTLAIEEQLIRQRAELEKKDLKNKAQIRMVDAKAEADIVDLRVAKAVEEQSRFFRIQQSGIAARLALVKKGTVEEADLVKQQITNQAQQERINVLATIRNANERKAKLAEIDASEKAQKLVVDAALKAQLAQNDAVAIQARLNAVSEGSDAEFALRKELLDAQMKAELENITLTEEQKKEIRSRFAKEQAAVDRELLVKQKNDAVTAAQSRLNVTKSGSAAEYRQRKELLAQQEALEIAQAGKNEVAKEEIRTRYARAQKDLTKEYFQDIADTITSTLQQGTSTLSAIYDAQTAIQQKALDDQQKSALKSAGANAEMREKIEQQFQKKREKLEKEAGEKRKAVAKIEARINQAQAITNILANNAGRPLLAALLVALTEIQTQAQLRKIEAEQFAQGGYVSDRRGAYVTGPGTGTSDSIAARISNGEAVINAESTRKHYHTLSAINMDGGGRRFPGALATTIIPRFNYGGVALQPTSPFDEGRLATMIGREVSKQMSAVLQNIPAPIVAVTDIHTKSAQMTKVQVRGDVTTKG